MSDGLIRTDPTAAGKVAESVAGGLTSLVKLATKKAKRAQEFHQSVETHKAILSNIAEHHDAAASRAVKTAQEMGYNHTSAMTVKHSDGSEISFGGNKPGSRTPRKTSTTTKTKTKQPAVAETVAKPAAEKKPAAPKAKPAAKPKVIPAESIKSRNKGK
jgi:hypothetical protein